MSNLNFIIQSNYTHLKTLINLYNYAGKFIG